ncbi:MAG: ABC transporter permease [Deltaproteobacteria bacterium]|nr:ABC transporter permease [Deltaproteobacteria bacterium]
MSILKIMAYLMLTILLLVSSISLAGSQILPRVAVCNTERWGIELSRRFIDQLSDRMAIRLIATNKFQILPREQTDALGPAVQGRGLLITCQEQACLISMLAGRSHALLMKYGLDFREYELVRKKVLEHPQVVATTPFVIGEAILSSDQSFVAALVEGTRSGTVGFLSSIDRELVKTHPEPGHLLPEKQRRNLPGIIIGKEMARRLLVKVGDRVYLSSPMQMIEGKDGPAPKTRPFVVAGTFSTGMFEWDERIAFLSLKNAQDFFNLDGSVTGLRLVLRDLTLLEKTSTEVCASLGSYPYKKTTFLQLNQSLFQALALEKKGKNFKTDKTLITQVIRIESGCLVTANLFDLESTKLDRSVAVNSSCSEKSLLDAMDSLARKLGGG